MSYQEDDRARFQQANGNSIDQFGSQEGFPFILYAMLHEIEAEGNSHIVSWQPHGRCFIVKKRKSFVEQVIPHYFRMSKFASFQRQLNLYGFHRITKGQDKEGYYHECFIRNRKDLCQNIFRLQFGGRKPKRIVDNLEPEPNFHSADYPIGSDANLKRPSTEPTNNFAAIPNTFSLPGMFATPQAAVPFQPNMSTTASIHPSLFMTSSSLNNGAFLQQQHQQQFTTNFPSLFLTSSSMPGGHIQHQQQVVMNHPSFFMTPSLLNHGDPMQQQEQLMMNAPVSLSNRNIAALQALIRDNMAQQQEIMMPPSTMFPSSMLPQQSNMLPPQTILQQLPSMVLHNGCSPSTSLPLYAASNAVHGPDNSSPVATPELVGVVLPANVPSANVMTGELSSASTSNTTTGKLSSAASVQQQPQPTQTNEPCADNRSFDAYLAALQFEIGDTATSATEEEKETTESTCQETEWDGPDD